MNTQNILQFYGSKFDLRLDNSEFYDFELVKGDFIDSLDVVSSYESVIGTVFPNNDEIPYQLEIGRAHV